jgi:hypothetical protein
VSGMILLLLPIILIELGLLVFALYDLAKRKKVRGGSKWLWLVIILFISLIGPIVYLILGREEE